MARTKADIQGDLDALTTALRPHLEELTDLVWTLDTQSMSEAHQAGLHSEVLQAVRALVGAAMDTPSWEDLFSTERVRGTWDTYRELAEEIRP